MNYELAKQLKDAGFDQFRIIGEERLYSEEYGSNGITAKDAENHYATAPSLSRLIKACGGSAKVLIQQNNDVVWEYAIDGVGETGDTPEEAVAKLYLKINK